jgi:ferredoxin--NADP+ reductase
MLGRRGPVEAAFTNVELREMGELENAAPVMNPDHLPGKIVADYMSDRDLRLREKNVETMRSFFDVSPEGKDKRVHFGFFLSPVEILGENRVEGVRCERTTVDANGKVQGTGEMVDIPAQIVITCIGSRAFPIDNLPFNDDWGIVENEDGKVSDRLYAVGWLKRGASGTIGTNKNDSLEVVDKLIAELDGAERDGCKSLDVHLSEKGVRVVSFEEWQIIDRLEIEAAPEGAPRKKFITPDEMIAALVAAQSDG